jgi:glycosyltransferase involved in cell wall biosynthesis
MKFRYISAVPFSLDQGGCKKVIKLVIQEITKNYEIKPFDFSDENIDFNVLLIFTLNAFVDPNIISQLKERGVTVIVFPVFDRLKPIWLMNLLSNIYFPIHNEYSLRKSILNLADLVVTFNQTEKAELSSIYKVDVNKINVLYLGLDEEFKIIADEGEVFAPLKLNRVSKFVFLPAASINTRKNQLSVIRALSGSDLTLVLNNTQNIEAGIKEEFQQLIETNENVICLQKLSLSELIWCYKNASVVISASNAETAGYTNLEAGYCGANLVLSALPVFYEYIGKENATYMNQNNINQIRDAVIDASRLPKTKDLYNFINEKFDWSKNMDDMVKKIKKLTTT